MANKVENGVMFSFINKAPTLEDNEIGVWVN